MTVMEFRVDEKGRLLLPAAARATAGLTPGSRVRGRVEPGRLTLEVPETVAERIWARAAAGAAATATDGCAPTEDRTAAAAHEAEVLRSRERQAGGPGIDEVGEDLLAELGL